MATRLLYEHVRYHWYVSVSTFGGWDSVQPQLFVVGGCVVAHSLK